MSNINLYNVDCLQFMKGVKDKAYDLAIVDPPYGIGNFSQSDRVHYKKFTWNEKLPSKAYFKELTRISKERIIWGSNYYNCFSGSHGAIIWDKLNLHPSMSRCEIASYSGQKKIDYVCIEWHGIVIKRIYPESFHPCAKPTSLYSWLLKKYASPGDKILDTHGGSMSIAIACYDLGFDLDICELDPDYFKAGQARLDAHIAKYAPASEIPVTKKGEIKLF